MAELTIGQRIAQERKKQNLSQVGLATILDVSRQAISKWESDAAIPEIDKLITLSRLFGVSIGWLLGVEEPVSRQEAAHSEDQHRTAEEEEQRSRQGETFSEEQYRILEELVRKYQAPPKPHLTVFHYLFAIGTSLLIFLFLYGATSRLEKQMLMYEANITGLGSRLEALENSSQISLQSSTAPGQLLAGYSFDLYPYTKTKSNHLVKASFSAVPHLWNAGDTGYLCVSGGETDTEPCRIKCKWDGGRLTAEAALEVTDGYQLYFAVEHTGGSREQQILEDKRIQMLAQECAIPIKVNRGSISYENGTLTLTDFSVNFNLPSIYQYQTTSEPGVTYCEYRLYRSSRDGSLPELTRIDMTDRLEPSTVMDYRHQVSRESVSFQNIVLENVSHFQLRFYVKLDSGVESEIPIAVLIPDGSGGLRE